MNPLVAAMWENQTWRLLKNLPDSVLAQIIAFWINTGFECLRRAARRFPPLCDREILSRPRTHLPQEGTTGGPVGPFAWPRFDCMSRLGQAGELLRMAEGRDSQPCDHQALLQLLGRGRYCDDCGTAEQARG